MKSYGWYFVGVGLLGLGTALARARDEREMFLVLATIPVAFLVLRAVDSLGRRRRE